MTAMESRRRSRCRGRVNLARMRKGAWVVALLGLVACNPARLDVRMPLEQPVTRASLSVRAAGEDPASWARWLPFGPLIGSGYFQSTWAVRNSAGRLIGGSQIQGRVAPEVPHAFGGSEYMVERASDRLSEFLLEAQ